MPPDPANPLTRGGATALASALPALAVESPARDRAHRRTVRSPERLEALLDDMGSQLQRGTRPLEPLPHHPCGIEAIDALLGGGFPGHRISEVVGAPSSGRTSVALSLLAHTTRDVGELVAVVDRADAFDPSSAEVAGVDLDRVLWARVDEVRAALRCVERLLETGGIPLVLLDLAAPALESRRSSRDRDAISSSVWTRLARCAAQTRSALIVLTPERTIGAQAEVALEMQPTRPYFSGTPSLLEQLETRAVLLRHRTAPTHRTATLRLGGRQP